MNILGLPIKRFHLKFTLPLLAVWTIALIWSLHHHLGNERYRLGFLASGVRGVAELNAAMIDPVVVSRINCETVNGGGAACGGSAISDGAAGTASCDLSDPCVYRHSAESRRINSVLRETLSDLRYLPYFSELYKQRVLRREDRVFAFRVEVQRLLADGGFIQVGAIHASSTEAIGTFGVPVARYAEAPGAMARARAAWQGGEPTEWITGATYQLFWPIAVEQRTVALLTLAVERERHSVFYTVGLVFILSFWFIGIAVAAVATSAVVGLIWLFNTLTIWGVGLILAVVVLIFWVRRQGGFGSARGRGGHDSTRGRGGHNAA